MPTASQSIRRRSLSDPLAAALRPPPNETPAEREIRLQKEGEAKKVSDAIDEQIRQERAQLKKSKADVKVLLLGQSESGKSTTLKRGCFLFWGTAWVFVVRRGLLSVETCRVGRSSGHE